MLKEKLILEERANKLDQYKNIYGALKFVILEYEEDFIENIYRLCQKAAIEGLKILRKRDEDYYISHRFSKEEMDRHLSIYKILNEAPRGEIITIEEFFGPYFDLNRKKLILRGRNKNFLNAYFYVGDEEKKENVVLNIHSINNLPNYERFEEIYKYSSKGYAKCFSDPPYGLKAENAELNQLFLDLNRLLFYDFKYPVWIYLWDENCSKFFERGKEWWGAYLWTIIIQENKEVIVITASSTD